VRSCWRIGWRDTTGCLQHLREHQPRAAKSDRASCLTTAFFRKEVRSEARCVVCAVGAVGAVGARGGRAGSYLKKGLGAGGRPAPVRAKAGQGLSPLLKSKQVR
jgi:hypothetical protein